MKPLTLKLKQKITYRIDMSFLSDAYKYKSIKHFTSKKIIYGNQEFKISELFSVKRFSISFFTIPLTGKR